MPDLVLERFFSRSERQQLFRSWAGSASLWVKVRFPWWVSVGYLNVFPLGRRRDMGKRDMGSG